MTLYEAEITPMSFSKNPLKANDFMTTDFHYQNEDVPEKAGNYGRRKI